MSKKKRGERMEEQNAETENTSENEALETMEAEVEAASDEEATQEAAREEIAEDTQKAEAAEALVAALAKQEEYLNLAQRVKADFENFRRRNQNVRKEAYDDGTRNFAATLLPVLDNLERAIAAAEISSDTALKEGVEMVYRQMCDAFTKRGITVIDRQGQPFDPNLENARGRRTRHRLPGASERVSVGRNRSSPRHGEGRSRIKVFPDNPWDASHLLHTV